MGHRETGRAIIIGVSAGIGHKKSPCLSQAMPLACLLKVLCIAGKAVDCNHKRILLSIFRAVTGGDKQIKIPGQAIDRQVYPVHAHLYAAFQIAQMIVPRSAPQGPAQYKAHHGLIYLFPGERFLARSEPDLRRRLVVDKPGPLVRLLEIDCPIAVGIRFLLRSAHKLAEIAFQRVSTACAVSHEGGHSNIRLFPGFDAI